ncbi:MAG: DUF3536 domain-containing protein [Planctomycetes bacterium]|nr:DUF3536 domain-containing protein [Planctomycetota bacterium]
MGTRFLCIHGHFYQPPRENAWLEEIELQESAHPWHDWNERIHAECYAANASSRILDGEGRIEQIVNNYSRISFDFGPTLLSWLQVKAPGTYQSILRADHESRSAFSGHGSAMAQCYNHMILPLANERDRRTQVRWAIRDFEHRFGRAPEGMWLPECAADVASLEALAEQGIRFTVLEPHQAAAVRRIDGGDWTPVWNGAIDPTMAYRVVLPSGRHLDVFFYDGPISRGVAFERILEQGERFAHRLLGAFSDLRAHPQLVHIATDGETYGHHHRHGEMALAYCLHYVEQHQLARLTNYGEFLELHPPEHEVRIVENTSWSCVHGLERWRADCGCSSGQRPGWHQRWRGPLRTALDWLRDAVAAPYQDEAERFLTDAWAARDAYVDVVLDRSPECVQRFLKHHARRELGAEERTAVLELLELQRHAMLMYTSCGWFFDEVSGLETVQVLEYAGRVLQLAERRLGVRLEARFLELLEAAESNLPERGNARRVYEEEVRPAVVDLDRVVASFVLSSLFDPPARWNRTYCYEVALGDHKVLEAGRAKLALGQAEVISRITRESAQVCYWALHFGDHHLQAGVRERLPEDQWAAMNRQGHDAFLRADFPALVRLLDGHFAARTWSLASLFHDEQRRILDRVLAGSLREIEDQYRHLHQNHAPLIRFLAGLRIGAPRPLRMVAEFVLQTGLRRALAEPEVDLDRVQSLLDEARGESVALDDPELGLAFARALDRMASQLQLAPSDLHLLRRLHHAVRLVPALPFPVDLWHVQNVCYELSLSSYPEFARRAEQGSKVARDWRELFRELAAALRVRVA